MLVPTCGICVFFVVQISPDATTSASIEEHTERITRSAGSANAGRTAVETDISQRNHEKEPKKKHMAKVLAEASFPDEMEGKVENVQADEDAEESTVDGVVE